MKTLIKLIGLLCLVVTQMNFAQNDLTIDELELTSNEKIHSNESQTHYFHRLEITDIKEEGMLICLNDGSEWKIKTDFFWKIVLSPLHASEMVLNCLLEWPSLEIYNAKHWNKEDDITIFLPGEGNLTDFSIVLQNRTQNEVAYTSLEKTPCVSEMASLWITHLDPIESDTQLLTLSNGLIIKIHHTINMWGAAFTTDMQPQKSWQIGDVVTLLTSSSYGVSHKPLKLEYVWNHECKEILYGIEYVAPIH